jgi:photosystem II stability/assembly factor-like uncharacterized protein
MKKNMFKKKGCQNFLIVIIITTLLLTTIVPLSDASILHDNRITTIFPTQGNWESQESGTSQDLSGVSFAEEDIGTIVGDSATILHTDDGGENWDEQTCGVNLNFYDVSFYDSDIGMTVGAEGTILNTNNGGNNWNTYQTGWMIEYYGCHMVTELVGYVVGVNTINQPLVTWTTNGWNSHNDVAFYLEQGSTMYEGKLFDVCFIDANTGYAAAAVWNGEGAIVKTINGGGSWDTIYWADHAFYGIDFPSTDVGYAVGNNGIIVKTANGGVSWQIINSGFNNDLADVSFAVEDIGTAVGNTGLIIRTEDGGENWDQEDSDTTNDLYCVDFIDSGNGYTVGNGGTILHYIGSDPPNAPEISGPSSGIVDSEIDFTFVTTDPDGEHVSYYIEWGDGEIEDWIGPFPSGEVKTFSHIWEEIGTFEVRAKARDINNVEGDWSEISKINISNPPGIPVIDGPTNGKIDQSLTYEISAIDPDGDDVYFWIEWFQGCPGVYWQGPYESGEIVEFTNTWGTEGTFVITVRAKDINDLEGDVGTLSVIIPRSRPIYNQLFRNFFHLNDLFPIMRILLRGLV